MQVKGTIVVPASLVDIQNDLWVDTMMIGPRAGTFKIRNLKVRLSPDTPATLRDNLKNLIDIQDDTIRAESIEVDIAAAYLGPPFVTSESMPWSIRYMYDKRPLRDTVIQYEYEVFDFSPSG